MSQADVSPCEALREEGEAAEDLPAPVELLHVGGGYHGNAQQAAHPQAIAHCNTTHTHI